MIYQLNIKVNYKVVLIAVGILAGIGGASTAQDMENDTTDLKLPSTWKIS